MEDHKPKKLTKAQAIDSVVQHYQTKLKTDQVKTMRQGAEVLSHMIIDNVEKELWTLDDVVRYCKNMIASKDVMEKILEKEV